MPGRGRLPAARRFRKAYLAYGVSFSFGSNSAAVMKNLQSLLPPGSKQSRTDRVHSTFEVLRRRQKRGLRMQTVYIALHDDVPLLQTVRLSRVYETVRAELHRYVASSTRSRVVVHAGVVALKNKAVLIPGASQSGKSTLVAEFVRAGARFYSDEYAMIDHRGRIHPFPRPIRIRKKSGNGRTRSSWITAESLGGRNGTRPIEIGMILLCPYRSNATWRPQRLEAGLASLRIMNHCLAIRVTPAPILKLLKQITQSVSVFHGVRGKAVQVVRWAGDIAALEF
jgi:hypothetical protein